jgi:3-oxoacyl-[acyl-carrier protein] reductase
VSSTQSPRGVALVTGAARGIGRSLALAAAGCGYDLAVHYRASEADALETVAQATALGVHAEALRADLSVEREARGLVDAAARLGTLRVLVNNVGDYHKGPLAELSSEQWHAMFTSNLHSVFYTCQQALPHLRAAGGGRIVNIGFAGSEQLRAKPGVVAYQIAKMGVLLYTKAIARSEAEHGISANVIAPGVIETSVSQPLDEVPMGRLGRLSEMAGALRYLLSDEAAYVTGVHLEVAGGWNS